jgi:hypothetical protein
MRKQVVRSHAGQRRKRQEACDQCQRHPVGNLHRKEIARRREGHQRWKQQEAGNIEDHEFTQSCGQRGVQAPPEPIHEW